MLVYAENIFEFDVSDFFKLAVNLLERGCDFGIFDFALQKFFHQHFVRCRHRYACTLARICRVDCDFKTRKSVVIGGGKGYRAEFCKVKRSNAVFAVFGIIQRGFD